MTVRVAPLNRRVISLGAEEVSVCGQKSLSGGRIEFDAEEEGNKASLPSNVTC
jgi:hypothetical protein